MAIVYGIRLAIIICCMFSSEVRCQDTLLQTLTFQVSRLQEMVDDLDATNTEQWRQLSQQTLLMDRLNATKVEHEMRIGLLDNAKQEYQGKIEELRASVASQADKDVRQDGEIQTLRSQLAVVVSTNENVVGMYQDITGVQNTHKQQIELLSSSQIELQDKVALLERRLDEVNTTVVEQLGRLNLLELDVDALKDTAVEQSKFETDMNSIRSELESKVTEKTNEIGDLAASLQSQEGKVTSNEQSVMKLDQEIVALKEFVNSVRGMSLLHS